MRTIKNYNLSPHFSLYEFIEGSFMSKKGHEMNWKHIDECDVEKLKQMAQRLEFLRDDINRNFKSDIDPTKSIGLQITSGWRCLAWELFRNRSGKGQHPIAAADVIPTNVSKELSDEIILWVYDKYNSRLRGWEGGFAIKRPTPSTTGFIHVDIRKENARWEY